MHCINSWASQRLSLELLLWTDNKPILRKILHIFCAACRCLYLSFQVTYYYCFNNNFHEEPFREVIVIHLHTYNLPTHNIFIIITIIHSCASLYTLHTINTQITHNITNCTKHKYCTCFISHPFCLFIMYLFHTTVFIVT